MTEAPPLPVQFAAEHCLQTLHKRLAAQRSACDCGPPDVRYFGCIFVECQGWAVTLLEPYVKKNPKNAKAREFLGRAYIGTGKLNKAETALKKALALNPRLKPTITYSLGKIAALRGDHAGAATALNDVIQQAPNSPLGTILRGLAPRRRPPGKPWFVTGSIFGGYNNNVIGLADGALLPADISSKDSNFIGTLLRAGYNWRVNDPTLVTVGYDWLTASYTDISGFDAQTHTGYAAVQYRVLPAVILGARLSGAMQLQDLDESITQIQLSPSAAYR